MMTTIIICRDNAQREDINRNLFDCIRDICICNVCVYCLLIKLMCWRTNLSQIIRACYIKIDSIFLSINSSEQKQIQENNYY